jgi:hypothetical protein
VIRTKFPRGYVSGPNHTSITMLFQPLHEVISEEYSQESRTKNHKSLCGENVKDRNENQDSVTGMMTHFLRGVWDENPLNLSSQMTSFQDEGSCVLYLVLDAQLAITRTKVSSRFPYFQFSALQLSPGTKSLS